MFKRFASTNVCGSMLFLFNIPTRKGENIAENLVQRMLHISFDGIMVIIPGYQVQVRECKPVWGIFEVPKVDGKHADACRHVKTDPKKGTWSIWRN